MGISSAFEQPPAVVQLVEQRGLDISEAWREAGLTDQIKIGEGRGSFYELTNCRFTRNHLNEEAVRNAIIPLIRKELYDMLMLRAR